MIFINIDNNIVDLETVVLVYGIKYFNDLTIICLEFNTTSI